MSPSWGDQIDSFKPANFGSCLEREALHFQVLISSLVHPSSHTWHDHR